MPGSLSVFGGGTVALLCAVMLARTLPRTRINLVMPSGNRTNPAAIADEAHVAGPSLARLHERIGLSQDDMLRRASASHCLALAHTDWRADGADWMIGYGAAGIYGPGIAEALARQGRFALPQDHPQSPLVDIDYALRFDPEAYRAGLRGIATRLGVAMVQGSPVAARCNQAGHVEEITLDTGAALGGEFFVDATGPDARLLACMGQGRRIAWASQLPVDRLLPACEPTGPELALVDTFTACEAGWIWRSPGRDGTRIGLAYSSSCTSDDAACDALARLASARPADPVALAPGRLEEAFVGNVVALGDAAAQFEPLGWYNLHLVARSVELLLELLPGIPLDALERREFNRRWALLADRTRDFVAAHYLARPGLETPFWQAAKRLERSSPLSLALHEFARRSRLVTVEEESLPPDAWMQLLRGGCARARPGPRFLAMDASSRESLRAAEENRLAKALHAAPPYAQWLANRLAPQHRQPPHPREIGD